MVDPATDGGPSLYRRQRPAPAAVSGCIRLTDCRHDAGGKDSGSQGHSNMSEQQHRLTADSTMEGLSLQSDVPPGETWEVYNP